MTAASLCAAHPHSGTGAPQWLGRHTDGDLYRIQRAPGEGSSLLSASVPGEPLSAAAQRMERGLALRAHLTPDFAAVPLQLTPFEGRPALLHTDPGGMPLRLPPGQPLPIARLLGVAIAAVQALGLLHERGIVHQELRPDNLLIDDAGRVFLTGFSRASHETRSQRASGQPLVSPHALPYMAPEQTGRIHRRIDTRTDLYAMGVILYRMACAQLPFDAADAAEWVHCHLAWSPVAPAALRPDVPEALSRIILRLLAKLAEERYQTASGLEADLRRCAQEFARSASIAPFALGQDDLPARLIISEQLFGRERVLAQLVEQFQRVAAHGRSALFLVAGCSGVGKSALVSELRCQLSAYKVVFAGGKCEQHGGNTPYSALAQAMRQLVTELLVRDSATLAACRQRLLQALDGCGQAIVHLVPEIVHVIGPQPALKDVSAAESSLRFQRTMQRFVSAFCGEKNPLVLFLDDLHWMDCASLDLLGALLANPDLRHVLLIGAYRSNEVDAAHPLHARLELLRQTRIPLNEVELQPLPLQALEKLVCVSLHDKSGHGAGLARLVWEKTRGNPLFSKQLLAEIAEQGLLHFDARARQWRWDTPAIMALGYSQNVAELVARRVQRMPAQTLHLLLLLACLGTRADTRTLMATTGQAEAQLCALLTPALEMGLVAHHAGAWRFLHDKIQEAAYERLPAHARAATHLDIARRLHAAECLAGEGPEALLFDMVNQYLRGDHLIETVSERLQLAGLYLRAARQAMADTAYQCARQYLVRATALLPADGWQRDYRLCFDLSRTQAQCAFHAGDPAAADRQLALLAGQAVGLVDRAGLAALQITVCLALDDSARAIATCLAFLGAVDAPWPAHPGRAEVEREYQALQSRLGGRSIAALADLPAMEDALRQAIMEVLAAVLPPAFFSDENLACLVLCRMVNLSIDHGNASASPLAYAYLGMMLGPYFHDYPRAFELGQLGFALVERGQHVRYRARVYMCFAYHVMPWTQDMRQTLPLLRTAYDITRETGDITYCGFTSCTLVSSMLFSGTALDLVEAESTPRLELMVAARLGLIVDIMRAQARLVATLQGRTGRFGHFDDDSFQEAAFERHLEANRSLDIAACWYWIRKAQARYLAGHIADALQALERAEPLLWTSKGHLEIAEFHFFSGLVHAAACAGAEEAAGARHRARLDVHLAQHADWAAHGRANFACRHALLAAEAARLGGDGNAALQLYDESASLAQQSGMPQIEALAFELAAHFHADSGRQAIAGSLRHCAREAWLVWGARGKAEQLQTRHAALAPRAEAPRAMALDRPLRSMDVETLLRISQALVAQKDLGRLVQTLVTLTLAHAGADRALLVLPHSDRLRIEAQAQTAQGAIRFELQSAPASAADLPLSVVHYALRTRGHVLIDDARQPGPFSTDPYLMQSGARSVLCLPLMRRGAPLGALYLENSLTGQVFTSERVALLALIASMAATSMENASLGEKESLLQEVHHRVKNNLQLISSLLSLQAARIADPAVAQLFAQSRNRVRSMALVHENLYRAGDFARVPMAAHLGTLCSQLGQVYGLDESRVRLRMRVSDIELRLDQAVSCSLIVNELVANALKHAFPGEQHGHIEVRMQQTRNQFYTLTVKDSGIGLPAHIEPAEVDTLGLQLVEDLSHQLRGTLSVQRGPGTRFTVEFPIEPYLHAQERLP
ncbi:MAG: AAA family ATPase [Comamonas sp.]